MKSSEIAVAAALHIQAHGWCQRYMETKTGRCCISGAICKVAHKLPNLQILALFAEIRRAVQTTDVMAWNDAKDRTENEVIGALLLSASNLASRGE